VAFREAGENDGDDQAALHLVLMALWKTHWPSDREQHFPDPTMCFLMLFSLREGGEFAQPKETTGPIAKLCRAIQLAMVQEIHRLVDLGEAPTQMAAWHNVAPFVVEKEMTTFNSLMSLQHYATALAYKSMSLPKIWWVDRDHWKVMLYDGNRITLSQLGEIFDLLEKEIIHLWENEVMLGLGLHVKYTDLADNLGQTCTGYSFLDDPSNPFSALGKTFGEKIFADPTLLAKFVTVDADGQGHVNVVFCRKWMMSLAKLEGLLMLSIDMISGAPPRGTELTAMLACNTENRGRNLRALGHFLAIVREYDKTTNNLQSDRLIPHALSAVNADILVQLHTFARPWARVSPFAFSLMLSSA
jgi:bloom syndrome protein